MTNNTFLNWLGEPLKIKQIKEIVNTDNGVKTIIKDRSRGKTFKCSDDEYCKNCNGHIKGGECFKTTLELLYVENNLWSKHGKVDAVIISV